MNSKTQCYNSGAVNLDTSATTYDITVAINFAIDGKAYSKSTVSNGASPTTDQNGDAFTALTAGKGCLFLWMMNSSGTVSVLQSDVVDLDGANTMITYPQFPAYDDDTYVAFAYTTVIAATGASSWTFGASNWDASNITSAAVNLCEIPSRPQGV